MGNGNGNEMGGSGCAWARLCVLAPGAGTECPAQLKKREGLSKNCRAMEWEAPRRPRQGEAVGMLSSLHTMETWGGFGCLAEGSKVEEGQGLN